MEYFLLIVLEKFTNIKKAKKGHKSYEIDII